MHKVDVAVIGGGIAGLWCANLLKARGYATALFSNGALGDGQTLAAQGVIHGGAKYAIAGKLTDSSEELAAMPKRWREAFAGRGEVDLSAAALLSDHQILWSLPGLASQAAAFFGSKLMRGRVDPLPRGEWPEALQDDAYRGGVFRIDEPVADPVSLVGTLADNLGDDHLYLADCRLRTGEKSERVAFLDADGVEIKARRYLLCAGEGNKKLLESAGIEKPDMQKRPLHQVAARGNLPEFYSVCIGRGPKPPVVVTTHRDLQGRTVWWIGGDLAEAEGVARSEAEQIEAAKKFLKKHLAWLPWAKCEFFTVRINRAEPKTRSGVRPAGAFCERAGNVLVTWPVKLALAPDLGEQVLRKIGIKPGSGSSTPEELPLPKPEIGLAPWDR